MVSFSWDRDYACLERELDSTEYRGFLTHLQRGVPFLRQFRMWRDVIAFMRAGTSKDVSKDVVLRPILAAHAEDQHYRWRTILLVIFWPGLMSIHHRRRSWDMDDPDERWQRIFWAFHESICRINLKKRPARLAQWIYNTTVHRLYEGYEREWKHAERERSTDPEIIQDSAGASDGIDLDGIELRDEFRRQVGRLQQHCQAGRITEADFYLIIGTRIYGQPVSEYARQVGLNPDTARKRRMRAEAAIRSHERDLQKRTRTVSRLGVLAPPFNM